MENHFTFQCKQAFPYIYTSTNLRSVSALLLFNPSYYFCGPSQVALVVRNPPANVGDIGDMGSVLGQEDPLKKEMATHSSILAWKTPWTEEPSGLQTMGLQESGMTEWLSMQALFL